jgi:MFS transporter, DHA2 family, multidrug resistance protein
MASAGTAVGPVLGGLLLEHYWWGSVFLMNLPVMAVLVVVGRRLLPESKDPAPGPWDLPSVALSMLTIFGLAGLVFFLSQFLQLVQMGSPFEAGLAELPAAAGAIAAGLVAGVVARRTSVRGAVSGGPAAVALALGACVGLRPVSDYWLLGALLLVLGLGAGLSFTVTADIILSTVPKRQAGAASAVSETAYELGSALGIALLESVITGFYRTHAVPEGIPVDAADRARASLGGAVEAAHSLPGPAGQRLLAAAQEAFTEGLPAGRPWPP